MDKFIAGLSVGMMLIFLLIYSATPAGGNPGTLRSLVNICEKSLPRDQKCIIVALPAQESVPDKSTEQKALNETKGDTK